MKAETGKLGASFQGEPPVDYAKMFNKIVMTIVAILVIVFWIDYSNHIDKKRSQSFNKCNSSYNAGVISTEYVAFMQACMK